MTGLLELARLRAVLSASLPRTELTLTRRAAVAIVLGPSAEPSSGVSLLLVRRSEREGDPWSGHMALPGGHAHTSDSDLAHTARRETLEEVGIDLDRAELLGRLDDVTPMRSSELSVRPFVFWTSAQPTVTLSSEVAEVLWVPLDTLASGTLKTTRDVAVHGSTLRVPAYVIGERIVWGMTFHVLERFLAEVCAP
jgi:8-oxo-dGTP pyrophosphatase MutT (NUDIX family)